MNIKHLENSWVIEAVFLNPTTLEYLKPGCYLAWGNHTYTLSPNPNNAIVFKDLESVETILRENKHSIFRVLKKHSGFSDFKPSKIYITDDEDNWKNND